MFWHEDGYCAAEKIEYLEAHARLLFGSHETSPIIWIGKKREMTGRSQTPPWWLGRGEVKTTANKIHWPHCCEASSHGNVE